MANVPIFLRPLARYVDFQGRSRRAEFWSFYLLMWIVSIALYGFILYPLAPLFQGKPFKPDLGLAKYMLVWGGLAFVVGLGLILPTLAVQVRRLHDSNRSGWWILLPTAVSMLGQAVLYAFRADEIARISLTAGRTMSEMGNNGSMDITKFFAAEWPLYQLILPYTMVPSCLAGLVLLVFYLWPGSKGDNRFGPNPRG